jgi:uncharacterized membrane protein YbhN (UPF0104 family)
MKKSIQVILTVIIITVSIIYLNNNRSQIKLLENINTADVIILFLLSFIYIWVNGYIFKALLSLIDVDLTASETIGLSILTSFGNYLGPTRPGALIKAVYLKSCKKLPYAKFVSVMSASGFLLLFMTGIVGNVLLILLQGKDEHFKIGMFVICGGLLIVSSLPFIFRFPTLKGTGKIMQTLESSFEGFNIIYRQKLKLVIICISIFAQFLIAAYIFFLTFCSLGISLTFFDALIIGVFTSISSFFTITPNNIGIQETVVAYLITVTGFDFATGVIGAGLLRAIHLLLTFSLGPLFAHHLLKSQDLSLKRIFNAKA